MNRFWGVVALTAILGICNVIFQIGIPWWIIAIIPLVPALIILGSLLALATGAVIMILGMFVLLIIDALLSSK